MPTILPEPRLPLPIVFPLTLGQWPDATFGMDAGSHKTTEGQVTPAAEGPASLGGIAFHKFTRRLLLRQPHFLKQVAVARVRPQVVKSRVSFDLQAGNVHGRVTRADVEPLEGFIFVVQSGVSIGNEEGLHMAVKSESYQIIQQFLGSSGIARRSIGMR